MLYVKYIYPTGQENVTGPYEIVSAEYVDRGGNHLDPNVTAPDSPQAFRVVYAYVKLAEGTSDVEPGAGGATMTYGPNLWEAPGALPAPNPAPGHRPGIVFVMNEQGATLAKYVL